MSRGYSAACWRLLNESISRSVVQVSVFKGKSKEPVHLGTGIILCDGPNCIAILTTVTCSEVESSDDEEKKIDDDNEKKNDEYKVFVGFGDLKAKQKIVVLDDESFYETDICKSEPVWVVGCFSMKLEQVMPAGYVSISDDMNNVRGGELVQTFGHSCPIGDGLVGAPIINRFGKIIGLNVTPTSKSSKLNHALKFGSLRNELAWLLDEEDFKPMSSLVSKLREALIDFRRTMKSAKEKTDGASSSSATAN